MSGFSMATMLPTEFMVPPTTPTWLPPISITAPQAAPSVNIVRVPGSGRAFENYGEDPYLAGQLAVANIRAIQSQGVLAEVKHFVANDQETDRLTINEKVDDRTLHEIYLPPFEAAVKQGNVAAVMCAYPLSSRSCRAAARSCARWPTARSYL